MNPKAQKDLQDYVLKVKGQLNDILNKARKKRKTDKWKACVNTCKIFLLRIEATHGVLTTWGNSDDIAVGDEFFLQSLYNPIISFWTNELNK